MYHAHEAKDCQDKVFAILNMSSDNPATFNTASLSPNYKIL